MFLGAENAAVDDGMLSGPLDLSYMGVYTIWMNLLGRSELMSDSNANYIMHRRESPV